MADMSVHSGEPPIRNFRVRFWGVQGSCPMFPEHHEVEDYKRLVVQDVLNRVFKDIGRNDGKCRTVEELVGGPLTPARVDAYQRKLGGADFPVYGGDTTCISIETAEGEFIVLAGGRGIRNCPKHV